MNKLRLLMTRFKLKLKIYLSLKRIPKQKIWSVIFAVYLLASMLLGGAALWKAIAVPAAKTYPQITFSEFLAHIKKDEIAHLRLKYASGGVSSGESTANQLIILMKLKTDEIFSTPPIDLTKLTYNEFTGKIKGDEVDGVLIIRGNSYFATNIELSMGWLKDKSFFMTNLPTFIPVAEELSKLFSEYNTQYWELDAGVINESNWSAKWKLTIAFLINSIVLASLVITGNYIILEKERRTVRDALAIKGRITFEDVAGIDEAKEEILEILDFIRYPERFIKHGAKMPRGILLVGPPGCGKTLMAKALSSEANVPFKDVAGSEFVEEYVGTGAKRVRALFREAKDLSLSKGTMVILFIDEIDALGTRRYSTGGGAEYAQTITQILHEMDGFEPNTKIFVLGATNAPDNLDPAIQRPGRFDRQIIIQVPDLKGRYEILKVHCKHKPLDQSIDLQKVAELTPLGFSGADLANVANEAAIRSARLNKDRIDMEDFEKSVEKVTLGQERKSNAMSEKDKSRTAYHEAGHAIVAKFTDHAMPPQKISIIPTTKGIGGFTRTSSKEDKYYWTKNELLAGIKVLFGGRIAEELIFGPDNVSTGAREDFRQATQLAEEMICDFGMLAEILGPQTFGIKEGNPYLGGTFRRTNYSEATAKAVDQAKKDILDQCYKEAKKTLRQHVAQLEIIARDLKKKEVLDLQEIEQMLSSCAQNNNADGAEDKNLS